MEMLKKGSHYMLNYIKSRYHLFILTFLIILVVEILNRDSLLSLFQWIFDIKDISSVLITYVMVYCLLLFFIALVGRTQIAYWIIASILLLTAFISGVKYRIIGMPLMPWDVMLTDEALALTEYLKEIPLDMIVASIAFIVISLVLIKKLPNFKTKFTWDERVVFLVLSTFLLCTIYTDKPIQIKKMMGIVHSKVHPVNNYIRNGFLLSTMLNIDQVMIEKPKGYSAEKIKWFIDHRPKNETVNSKVNPNIIVILSESLWDPTKIKSVKFSQDPMSFYHSLQKKYSNGEMLSPQFGGWTANVEFEVLTGNTVRFLPPNSVAYNQYINQGVDSLASILGRQGYSTTAITPLHNWYYSSKKVYRNFGFSRYISGEFFEPHFKGLYIADSEVTKKIIETTGKSPGPDFIFANTMENHGPYIGKFKHNPIKVEGNISPQAKEMLETYATGVADADLMLKTLVEHYQKSKEPTIIVFFGDHLPALGKDYQVYKETKYISGNNDPDFLKKMYSTPLMVWNNYLPEHKDQLDISPPFVGPYVLKLAQKEGTYYTDYLYNLSKRYPIIPPKAYFAKMGINEKDIQEYEMLQYDILFGKRYGYAQFKDRIVSQKFTLGYGKMTIDHVTLQQLGNNKAILVTGKNFTAGSLIYLNGEELKTKWQQDGSLIAILTEEQVEELGHSEIQVKNVDSKKADLAVSNIFKMQTALK